MVSLSLILLSSGILLYGIVPLFADLSKSHAFNSEWPAHARFHVVGQVSTNFMIALIALCLLWLPGFNQEVFVNISVLISLTVICGFFLSTVFWCCYKGKFEVNGLSHRNIGGNTIIFGLSGLLILAGKCSQ